MTLILELPDNKEAALRAMAQAQGISAEKFAAQVLDRALEESATKQPLSARIREIWTDMPDAVRAKLPVDGASQHDHYIYGVLKTEQ